MNIKFINRDSQEKTYEPGIKEISRDESPFKEIIDGEDFSELSFSLGEENILLSDLFQLKVNVKKVGSFYFFLKSEGFNKQELIQKIGELKEMPINNLQEAKAKVSALLAIMKEYDSLFVLYTLKGELRINANELGLDGFLFVLDRNTEVAPVKEEKEEVIKEEEPKKGLWAKIKDFFSPLSEQKIHYIFSFVASFLISFTVSIGVYNCYAGKKIYLFFFVCGLIGTLLTAFIFMDFFKLFRLKSKEYVLSIGIELIGVAVGLGGFGIFNSFQKEMPASLTSVRPIILIDLVASILLLLGATLVSFVLRKFILKNKPDEDDEEE